MRAGSSHLELSATDLSQFLSCRHLTALEMAVTLGQRAAPSWADPVLQVLRERGLRHEHEYAQVLRSLGLTVTDLSDSAGDRAEVRTVSAMREGTHFILQGTLRHQRWTGRPDVLRRAETASAWGAWSYEALDTKLARDTRGGTILQLSLYSELLAQLQGLLPEFFHVVTPDAEAPVQSFRVADFSAYFRLIRTRLEDKTTGSPAELAAANYPEPVEYCDVCRWRMSCSGRRHTDDHLSLVAGISHLQTRELQRAGVATLTQLAELPLPLPFSPRRGAPETYARVREQARVQRLGRTTGAPVYELLPIDADFGLARLPTPSAGDLFLDIEGDPFVSDGGQEYLMGLVAAAGEGSIEAQAYWGLSQAEERAAFEHLVDEIVLRWQRFPDLHVFHYAPYEPAALRRLMSRHATREAEVDRMLRAGLFVDLYTIVRRSLRASVENYSIKDLEVFYHFERSISLADARTHLRLMERGLELEMPELITDAVRQGVEAYNRDDCVSAQRLRGWLEVLRSEAEQAGAAIPRPPPGDGSAPERVEQHSQRVRALVTALLTAVPEDAKERTEEQQARWLLAHLLDWHRRENKAPWWEFYRLRDLAEEDLVDEKAALGGLKFLKRTGGTARSPIDCYSYPPQDSDIRDGDSLHLIDGTDFGSVDTIDRIARTISIKKRGAMADTHPTAVFAHSVVNSDVLADALLRIAADVVAHGVTEDASFRATRELLLARPPKLRAGAFEPLPDENAVQFAIRISTELEHSVLAIQGPPGAGKTYTGARMIAQLVQAGARVGVTAVSHKVIRKLLEDAEKAAAGLALKCLHKVTARSEGSPTVAETTDNADALTRLRDRRVQVLGGTTWLWARPDAQACVDVLFVDEAGQMSLANVLAASQAARSLVLLGDPQQLEQPQQGVHPPGADRSALQHLLGGHPTVPPGRGIFLPETWRLAPALCAFTSEVFYEGRLSSRPGLDRQQMLGLPGIEGAGLWIAPIAHEGNPNASPEEAELVQRIARILLERSHWVDREGIPHVMTGKDILVVAPYNAQVGLLGEHLAPLDVRVGTVDRFQGQEAPVVIYSMATSSPEDAPRGMEFLYSLNRLNVATSRAQCACILVASPRLFEPDCKSPHQMRLANALCRYVEMARRLELPA